MTSTLWFNAKCSKCREALALLEARGVHPKLRHYLDELPTRAELEALYQLLGFSMVRTKEDVWLGLGLHETSPSREVIAAIEGHPILLERPIFVRDGRAIVGRPAPRVLEIF